jgi:hypothetical protein
MQSDFITLLGLRLDDIVTSTLVRSLGEQPKVELIHDTFYMEMRNSGLSFIAPLDGIVTTIMFYSDGYEGYKGFTGALPDGVSFSDSRNEVSRKLGEPSNSGGNDLIPYLGKASAWDRYDRDAYALHFTYANGERSILLVTLMRPDAVPESS